MKIIIAGGGKVGSALVEKLSEENHDITLIDMQGPVVEDIMEKFDIIGVCGNAAAMSVLEQAGVREANLLIAVSDADEVNLLACLTAHSMNPDLHTIARIRNADYREQSYLMRGQYALNMIINPEEACAMEIARLLQMPGFLKIENFTHGDALIAELRVKKGSPLDGLILNKLGSLVPSPVLACAVQREEECIIPDGSFVLKADDSVYFTASQASLAKLLKSLGVVSHQARNALIVGGSRISEYLAMELEKTRIQATIIEIDPSRCTELATKLPDAVVLQGDGSSQAFLDKAGIGNFDSFVALTGLDELNIVMSLYASERNIGAIVTKLSHAENNRTLDNLAVGSVVSPKDLVSDGIIRYVRGMQNKKGAAETIHMIAGGMGEAIEFNVEEDTKYQNIPLKDIPIRKGVLLASISRGWHSELPKGNSRYHKGDTILLTAEKDCRILTLNDIFEERA